jgi:hypothetical protein
MHNGGGTLTAKPLLKEPLPLTAQNWKRMLYVMRRQDTVAALMHDVVLVPEGRTDFDLLSLMVSGDETRRAPAPPPLTNEFGSLAGLIPTHDANVVGVYDELSKIHERVFCLVDGDPEGSIYATNLLGLASPPAIILQWPAGWTIEDILGWIAAAGGDAVLQQLSEIVSQQLADTDEFTTLLKTPSPDGRKGDQVAYELIVGVLGDNAACLQRIRDVLRRMASACSQADPPGWTRQAASTARTKLLRFNP